MYKVMTSLASRDLNPDLLISKAIHYTLPLCLLLALLPSGRGLCPTVESQSDPDMLEQSSSSLLLREESI